MINDVWQCHNDWSTISHSPWYWSPKNYTDDLGGIERNATGHVVGAKAIWVQILVEVAKTPTSSFTRYLIFWNIKKFRYPRMLWRWTQAELGLNLRWQMLHLCNVYIQFLCILVSFFEVANSNSLLLHSVFCCFCIFIWGGGWEQPQLWAAPDIYNFCIFVICTSEYLYFGIFLWGG